MFDGNAMFMFTVFLVTILFIIWRPFGINESYPSGIGAAITFLAGIVGLQDIYKIVGIVSPAAITILSTIVMSIVLESIGLFKWAAYNIAARANGSGVKLFWYINLLCFLMTLFFNNDGSILITTPIIIQILTILNLKHHQKIIYLLSGALIATGASAPIGVSNLANLIALNIVGLDLNSYAAMMFVPSIIGLTSIACLLFSYFRKSIPIKISRLSDVNLDYFIGREISGGKVTNFHPLKRTGEHLPPLFDWRLFKICLSIVVSVRVSFFLLAPFGIAPEWPAVIGAGLLIGVRWYFRGIGAIDVVKKTPWYILIFAFSMYVIVYGLHNSGLTALIINGLRDYVSAGNYTTIFIVGLLLTVMSNLLNNLPSVMIGTITLTEMGLNNQTLHVAYLANIIGSDIGSLLLPMGTLASLIWMFILRQNQIKITWGDYLKVTILVIPLGLLISLLSLYFWIKWFIH
ncbi:arsenic transporter [Aneurinibacillus terranovensis]|uniref:arsenic transporter n=1 Tax=Aneurinibacillus terranovensis TaxID=278991 RepID=UPI00040C569A|nr:arsenic transporter [Aneurinibacillus terranovensis]